MTTTTTPVFMLKGDAIVTHNAEWMELINRGEKTRTEMVKDAGYVYDNGKPMYVDYYTELLNAKGIVPAMSSDVEDAEYEALSGEQQDLYDLVHDKFGYTWSHEEIMEFMDELDDIGITTPEQVDDAYEWDTEDYDPEEKFAEYFVTEVLCQGLPEIVEGCVDWQAVWDSSLRYDYNTIEFYGVTYFFRNN